MAHGPDPCVRRLGRCLPNNPRSRDLRSPATDALPRPGFVGLQEIVIRRCAADSKPPRKSSILNTKLVGGPGFEPGASRSRTVSGTCPQVSDGLPRCPREYEIDQPGVLW